MKDALLAALLLAIPVAAAAAGATPADAAALLALAQRNAGPPRVAGAVLEVSYSITLHEREGTSIRLADFHRLSASNGRTLSTLRSASGREMRAEDGHSFWISPLPPNRSGPVELVTKALDLAGQLDLSGDQTIASAKRGKARGRPTLKLKLEGGRPGVRSIQLDATTGDLLQVRESDRLAPTSVTYSDWRAVGEQRVPGKVELIWSDARAVASLNDAQLLVGVLDRDLESPGSGLVGSDPAACQAWSEPELRLHSRLGDLLWDHALPPSRQWGSSRSGSGARGYALTREGSSSSAPGQLVNKKYGPTKGLRMSSPGVVETAAGSSEGDATLQLGDHPRSKSARVRSTWRVLARVAADGSVGPMSIVQGPKVGWAEPMPTLRHYLAFEPARCEGRPVAAWHEFELTWPLGE